MLQGTRRGLALSYLPAMSEPKRDACPGVGGIFRPAAQQSDGTDEISTRLPVFGRNSRQCKQALEIAPVVNRV